MKIGLIDSIKYYLYENINWQLFLTTSLIFIVSLIYFLYRNYHLLDNIPNNNQNSNNQNINSQNQQNENDFIDLEIQFDEERKEYKINKMNI